MTTIEIPMQLPSRANLDSSRAWRRRAALVKRQRAIVAGALLAHRSPQLPATVRLWRISPRLLDDDNLAASLKAVRDAVARWLGADDADPRIVWLPCRQERDPGRRRGYQAARVEVWPGAATCCVCGQHVPPDLDS